AGWNQDEMENHGTVYETRFKVMADRVKAIKALWTQEEASYYGEFTQFEPVWSWPKPVQKPHPPVLLGGETRHSLRRVLSFCDGWLPRGNMAMADPHKGMAELRNCAEELDRDAASIPVSVFRALPEEDYLNKCREAGVTRVLFQVPSKSKDEVMPLLDQYATLFDH
ncbi:MAG TPA: LLM class flavin-dependent oxidoreductase, partial [Gammaproteobacteria bacterium]|nr:LLM class flavin-dependent oxidoreductase [Gammaproteobacteria bacterium]